MVFSSVEGYILITVADVVMNYTVCDEDQVEYVKQVLVNSTVY